MLAYADKEKKFRLRTQTLTITMQVLYEALVTYIEQFIIMFLS